MFNVETFIQHYESQPYDPVKAHEYYVKNRKLTGRQTGGLSEKQKEAWGYTKDQITTEKTAKVTAEQEAQRKKVEEVQVKATETRSRIVEKLKLFSAKLAEKVAGDREQISAEKQAKIDNLPEIPKGLSPERRAIEMAKRKQEISSIRGDAKKDSLKVSTDSQTERAGATDEASGELEKTRSELQTVITSAKEAFATAKAQLDAGYETTYQTEYDKILATVPGKEKPKKGKGDAKKGGYYIWKGEKTSKK